MSGRPSQLPTRRGLGPKEAAGIIFLAFVVVVVAIIAIGSIAILGLKTTALILACFAAGFIVRGIFP